MFLPYLRKEAESVAQHTNVLLLLLLLMVKLLSVTDGDRWFCSQFNYSRIVKVCWCATARLPFSYCMMEHIFPIFWFPPKPKPQAAQTR